LLGGLKLEKPVVLFMKGTPSAPQCGFSRATVQILGIQGVDPSKFASYNVLEDPELRAGTILFPLSSFSGSITCMNSFPPYMHEFPFRLLFSFFSSLFDPFLTGPDIVVICQGHG